MKKTISIILMMIFLSAITASTALAKCYRFQNEGEIQVCVPGDSFSDRKKAMEICKKAKGSDCGSVSSYSSSCHSNSNQCYDENGNAKRDLSGY
ncbi:MAG: hypothetical protein CVV44_16805 [Spirochaetae bacterium HGW-Spirochaetae-1]|nr:MAG: hypothetical protein CVV44_16805 [Spirochaetae bacterium HGW-Spirochaetae-1]